MKINTKTLGIDQQRIGIQLAEYMKNLIGLMDSDFMISNLILPETVQYHLSIQLIDTCSLDAIGRLSVRGLSLQILALQMKRLQSASIEEPKTNNFLMVDYLQFLKHLNEITKKLSSKISIQDFCKSSGISKNKLQSICKDNFGTTFKRLIKDLRLEKARYLIQNTELSMSQICYDIGYTSRSFFSKEYKEKFGLNPIDYKKELDFEGLSYELSYFVKLNENKLIDNIDDDIRLLSEACESFGVTGVLIYFDKTLFHIMEGSKSSVLSLFDKLNDKITKEDISMLFKGIRSKPRFPRHEYIILDETLRTTSTKSFRHFESSVANIIYGLDHIYLSGDLLWKRVYSLLKTSKSY